MIVLETIGAYGALRGSKMGGKLFGISIMTIILVFVAYLVGVKFAGPGQKLLGLVGQ